MHTIIYFVKNMTFNLTWPAKVQRAIRWQTCGKFMFFPSNVHGNSSPESNNEINTFV